MLSIDIIKMLAVTAELTGTSLSADAARILASDLEPYPEDQVMGALARCRHELRGRMTLSDILMRLDDGRPGVEEAWAMAPRDEYQTVVWTDEMAEAWGAARPLLASDEIAARMTFREVYTKLVIAARREHRPPRWWPSLGHDVLGREGPLREAVAKKRLTAAYVQKLLPAPDQTEGKRALTAAPVSSLLPRIAAQERLRQIRAQLGHSGAKPALATPQAKRPEAESLDA